MLHSITNYRVYIETIPAPTKFSHMLSTNKTEPGWTILNSSKSRYTSIMQTPKYTCFGREEGDVEFFDQELCGTTKIFEKTFDSLESENINKYINAMAYMDNGGVTGTLFSGNDIHIKAVQVRADASTLDISNGTATSNLRFVSEKLCQNVHTYILRSLSVSSCSEYLISSDYIKINLWNPQKLDSFYNIVDIKSQLTNGVVFVINVSHFSPFSDSIFGYSTSNGRLVLNDTSITPKSEPVVDILLEKVEGIRSISDFSFLDENRIVTRTMNNVSMFDIRNTKTEVFSIELERDAKMLNKLNNESAIYERFSIAKNGGRVYTGSYFGSIYIIDTTNEECVEVSTREKREYVLENKIKMVAYNGKDLMCVMGDNTLVKYDIQGSNAL